MSAPLLPPAPCPCGQHHFRGMNCHVGINLRCPSCANPTLFIDDSGHLTCSGTNCKAPILADHLRPAPAWTQARPTGAGLYGCRKRGNHDVMVVRVSVWTGDPEMYVIELGSEVCHRLSAYGTAQTWWLGPLDLGWPEHDRQHGGGE